MKDSIMYTIKLLNGKTLTNPDWAEIDDYIIEVAFKLNNNKWVYISGFSKYVILKFIHKTFDSESIRSYNILAAVGDKVYQFTYDNLYGCIFQIVNSFDKPLVMAEYKENKKTKEMEWIQNSPQSINPDVWRNGVYSQPSIKLL